MGGLLERARALEPLIRRHEETLERERRPPAELVDALYDSGVFLAHTPREVGGVEADLMEWLDAVEELSRINGSVGWNAFINSGITMLPAETMRRILARERWISAGSIGRAAGRAHRVEGGYRVSGRWPFTSGAPFATYLFTASLLYDGEERPVVDAPTGMPKAVLATCPAAAATLHDNWDGLGLRGTGSVDVELLDVFVPDDHVSSHVLAGPYAGPLFRGPYFVLMGHCAHALGLARCAIDAFVELVGRTQARPAHGSRRQSRLGQQQAHQVAVARAESLVRSARLFAWDAARRGWEQAQARPGQPVDLELRVLMAQSMIHSARAAKEAVDLVFEAAGSSGVYRGQTLERCYRDIATAAQHTLMVETSYESIGQYYLTRGLPDGPRIDPSTSVIFP
ncbi:MAG TPA: acyl-CoA dehydrogenase family protein [Candidatus Dormibacteraeota bacterium]|nr:acyl-CoA dehydrogenase family protein [Candidatus Dormibacteraeota bacterium]